MRSLFILLTTVLIILAIGCEMAEPSQPLIDSPEPLVANESTAPDEPPVVENPPIAETPIAPVVQAPTPPQEVTIQIPEDNTDFGTKKVVVGTKVTWENPTTKRRLIAADGWIFKSDNLETGDTFSHTFNEAGEYPYREVIYGLRGTIIVEPKQANALTGNFIAGVSHEASSSLAGVFAGMLVILIGVVVMRRRMQSA